MLTNQGWCHKIMTVVLRDIRKTVKISLPSYEGSEVELYDGLLFGQMKNISDVKGDDIDRGLMVLQYLIKDWNFTNEKEEKILVNKETLNSFPLKDLTILMEKSNEILEEISKKKEKPSKEQS